MVLCGEGAAEEVGGNVGGEAAGAEVLHALPRPSSPPNSSAFSTTPA